MDYVYAERVGEVEVEYSFHDITISDWITINSLLFEKNKEPHSLIEQVRPLDERKFQLFRFELLFVHRRILLKIKKRELFGILFFYN